MTKVVVIDSGPVRLLCRREVTPPVDACREWQVDVVAHHARIILPEIVDYEERRELIRLNSLSSIERLDSLTMLHECLPLTTERVSAEFNRGGR